MGKHVSALGFLYAFSGLVASVLGVVVLLVGGGTWGRVLKEFLDLVGLGHLAWWLGAGFGASLLGGGLLAFITAFGLFARKGWGRLLGVVGSAGQVLTLSWASLIGIYGLWVLFSEDGRREFQR
jgi:hypothetical protein